MIPLAARFVPAVVASGGEEITVLRLEFDPILADASDNGFTVSEVYGTAAVKDMGGEYGNALILDDNAAWVEVQSGQPNYELLEIGTKNFSINFDLYFTAADMNVLIGSSALPGSPSLPFCEIDLNSSELKVYIGQNNDDITLTAPFSLLSASTWHHFELRRDNGVVKMLVDEVEQASATYHGHIEMWGDAFSVGGYGTPTAEMDAMLVDNVQLNIWPATITKPDPQTVLDLQVNASGWYDAGPNAFTIIQDPAETQSVTHEDHATHGWVLRFGDTGEAEPQSALLIEDSEANIGELIPADKDWELTVVCAFGTLSDFTFECVTKNYGAVPSPAGYAAGRCYIQKYTTATMAMVWDHDTQNGSMLDNTNQAPDDDQLHTFVWARKDGQVQMSIDGVRSESNGSDHVFNVLPWTFADGGLRIAFHGFAQDIMVLKSITLTTTDLPS